MVFRFSALGTEIFTPGNNPGSHFCRSLFRFKGHSAIRRITSMKNSSNTSGIEAATFRFVAQHLNHCANAVPQFKNFGHRNRQIMKQAYELGAGINRTYIQPVVCKSPTRIEVSIDDVQVIPD